MSKKLDELVFEGEGKPTKKYSFEANCEYQGAIFHKFQRSVKLNAGMKWQTLTISPRDWEAFAEWMEYVLAEMKDIAGSDSNPPEDVPF